MKRAIIEAIDVGAMRQKLLPHRCVEALDVFSGAVTSGDAGLVSESSVKNGSGAFFRLFGATKGQ